MFSIFKVSAGGIAGVCLAIILSVGPLAACGHSARPGAASVSLASVALILLSGVPQSIGVSQSMEAVWISSEKQWNDLVESAAAEMMEISPAPAPRPDVDFTKCGVLVIRMGEKPNGGYRLTLTADEAAVANREARIPVHLSEPEPDSMYTQAIVYPHLAIKMEKGAFDSITVVDQNGLVKLRLSIH